MGGGEKDGSTVPVFLRENFSTPRRMPTQTQVRDGIQWLLHDARPGDTLVFGESTRSYIVRERRSAIKAEVGSAPTHDQGAVRAEIDVPTPHTL